MMNDIMTHQHWRKSTPEERVPNAAFSGPSLPNPLLPSRPPISKPKDPKDPKDPIKIIHQLWEWRKPENKEQSSARSVELGNRLWRKSTPEERVPNFAFPGPFPNNPTIRPYPPLYPAKPPLKLIRVKHKPWEIGRPEEEAPNFPFPEPSPTNPLLLPEPPVEPVRITHKPWDVFNPEENMLRPTFPGPSTVNPSLQEEPSERPIEVANQLWKRSRPEERVPNYEFPGPSTIHPIIIHKPLKKPVNFRKYSNKFLAPYFSRKKILESRNLEGGHFNVPKRDLPLLRPHISHESLSKWNDVVMMIMLSTIFLAIFIIVIYRCLNRRYRAKNTLLGGF